MNDSRPKLLDRLILADAALAIVSMAASSVSVAPRLHGPAFLLWLWIAVCIATVAAWIGLAFRFRPARVVYAGAWLGYLALVAMRPNGTASAFDNVLDLAAGLVGGMILAVAFFSDALAPVRPPAEAVA